MYTAFDRLTILCDKLLSLVVLLCRHYGWLNRHLS